MAKAAILDVLESTIGRYVLNLDSESLNVAVWAGKIELNSLKLDVDNVNRELARKAVDAPNLAIPFRVLKGEFQSLRVDVPWARITSRPVVLRATGLDVLIEPYDHLAPAATQKEGMNEKGHTSEKKKKKKKKEKKDERQQSLDYAEEGRQRGITMRSLANMDDDDEMENDKAGNSRESSSGFKAKLARRIIENLQLQIDGVQLKMRGQGCNAGIVLDHFSVSTTDEYGNQTFIDRVSNSKDIKKLFLYKSLKLKGLGIYCDEDTTSSAVYSSKQFGRFPSSPTKDAKTSLMQEKSFILAPLSFEANLRQSDCVKCVDFPKYALSTQLNSVSIVLYRTQLEIINYIARDLLSKRHASKLLFPEYRPSEPIKKGNAKLWWKYAVRCIGRINRRRSWVELMIAFRKRKAYIKLYKRRAHHVSCSWLSPLTISENVAIMTIEADKTISVPGIMNWRNMADAQVEFEQKKYEATAAVRRSGRASPSPHKKSYFSSLFGSKKGKVENVDQFILNEDHDMIDEPPIQLTQEEMNELEAVALDVSSEDDALSKDSVLCDVKFMLGSFKVDIITFGDQPVASLEMGTVLTSFIANADGSFYSDFSLSSLNIHDRITPKSIFPLVIRSLQASSELQSKFTHAFQFQLKKARNGDQELIANMVSFEIVASPILLKEICKFVAFEDDTGSQYQPACNPTLEETISGGADLFYDAAGTDIVPPSNNPVEHPVFNVTTSAQGPGKLASAFADAWGDKVEKETLWTINIEIHAPILVVPQSCVDPMATTLVIDLGNFCLTFGRSKICPDVQRWFDEQPKADSMTANIDSCMLKMENLSFVIAKASDKDWINSKFASGKPLIQSEAIIAPITLSLNIGIENKTSNRDLARKCMYGVLPAINLNLSFAQIARIVSVVTIWKKVIDSVTSGSSVLISEGEDKQIANEKEDFIGERNLVLPLFKKNSIVKEERMNKKHNIIDRFHFSISLQKLSMKISNDDEESVEFHLVSATASYTQRSDDSSSIRVLMGWFWILDRLNHERRTNGFPRRQRLVAHSFLPTRSASSYAKHDKYDIMKELEKRGVFESHHPPTGSLADVTITKSSTLNTSRSTAEASVITSQPDFKEVTNIDAKFRTLFIHWNPYGIRNLLDFKETLAEFITTVVSLPVPRTSRNIEKGAGSLESKSLLILDAEMEAFSLCLNSAKDDLPLFEMTMSDSKVKLHLSNGGSNLLAYVCIGDFRLETPSNDIVLKDYQTLLGLSPNQTSSLLSIEYGKGPVAMQSCDLQGVLKETTDSYMKVVLSPMRFVHVQAQVLTLVEYLTEGILGAMAEKVAISAAEAAKELAKATEGENVFHIIASGFDLVLPQAAYSHNHFLLHSGNLYVRFTSFPRPGHGVAALRLEDVTMECNQGETIVETPIRMTIDVNLAPHDLPTEDEKAMKVDVSISRTAFLITRQQYCQINHTLEHNISQSNNFFRNDTSSDDNECSGDNKVEPSNESKKENQTNSSRTHSGAEEISIERRIYLNIKFQSLCLELCNVDTSDPIISIAAVETSIAFQLLPDEQKTCIQATLLDLVCDDKRIVSLQHHFRQLIRQVEDKKTSAATRDVFQLLYINCKVDNSMTVDMTIGSPQVVLIPSVISELLNFFKQETHPLEVQTNKVIPNSMEVCVDVPESEGNVEVHMLDYPLQKPKTSMINFRTSDCRLVMIDMDCSRTESAMSFSSSSGDSIETIVLKGQAEGKVKLVTGGSNTNEMTVEMHGETIEMYTAEGQSLKFPVQILDPLKFSAFFTTKIQGDTEKIDASFVTLSDYEMTLSMKNVALFMAIFSSMSEAFTETPNANESPGSSTIVRKLSYGEANAIENLAHDLERIDEFENESLSKQETISHGGSAFETQSSRSHTQRLKKRDISLKMTLPRIAVTMVNDMQGLDEALFKIIVTSCVCGADFSMEKRQGSKPTFRIYFNTSVQSDFFDSQSNFWEPLLVEPWELHVKATRGKSSRFDSSRLATTVDIDSHPCKVSFSEQFIIGLGAAKSMWSVFSGSSKKANSLIDSLKRDVRRSSMISSSNASSMRRSAVRAARCLVTSLPYAIENHSGTLVSFEVGGKEEQVSNDATQYFTFDLPRKNGVGGSRAYGQDSKQFKSIKIYVDESEIFIQNLDEEVNKEKRAHCLRNGICIFSHVTKIYKVTRIHLSSFIALHNETSLDFMIDFKMNDSKNNIGTCRRKLNEKKLSSKRLSPDSKHAPVFGIPLASLQTAYCNETAKGSCVSLMITPKVNVAGLRGEIKLPSLNDMGAEIESSKVFLLSCFYCDQGSLSDNNGKMVLQVTRKITLVGGIHPLLEFFLQPRKILYNNMFINIEVRTCMPHTYSNSTRQENVQSKKNTVHRLEPFDAIESYTPGSVVSVSIKCADRPAGGGTTTWNAGGWIDIPLDLTYTLQEHLRGIFPFVDRSGTQIGMGGSEFIISEPSEAWEDLNKSVSSTFSCSHNVTKKILFSVYNIGVDHTGDILFLKCDQTHQTSHQTTGESLEGRNEYSIESLHPLSAFSSSIHKRRITILPQSSNQICLLQLTIDGISGTRRSLPFCIEDISLCEGGLESTPIQWENVGQQFYAYRRLSSVDQYEVHVIPEFVIFNGSDQGVRIKQPQGNEFVLETGKMAPIHRPLGTKSPLMIIVDFLHLDCCTDPIRVDTLGLKVCVLKSSGFPVGSVACQVCIGRKDSRFIVKLGKMSGGTKHEEPGFSKLFENDFIRFRVRWSQLEVELQDTSTQNTNGDILALKLTDRSKMIMSKSNKNLSYSKVAHVLFERFTIDFQRVYKEEEESTPRHTIKDTSRSQFAMLCHNIRITDCSGVKEQIVLESSAVKTDLIDLRVRTRGSTESGLICVDLLDLKIAHDGKKAEQVNIKTNEAFLWSLLDITARTQQATSEMSGVDLEIEWDDDSESFFVYTIDIPQGDRLDVDDDGEYRPPRSDQLYAVRTARVSPMSLQVSFKRKPIPARYKRAQNVRSAKLVNYFMKKLKFTVENAKLDFAGYTVKNVNGPPDRIVEVFKAFYYSQIKKKLMILIAATSLDDWKLLADREGGNEKYVDGDILRVTGNFAGKSAGFILKNVGKGVSHGLSATTSHIGDGIQNATEVIGIGSVGAGVNSLVSGIGGGVGNTVEGVGRGGSEIIKGAGKGVGQIIGGVSGGLLLAAKGIGKGVVKGDGKALASGLGDGVVSIGSGFVDGAESVVNGTTQGVFSVGKGLFTGLSTIGKGVGNAVKGRKPRKENIHNRKI